MPGGAARSAINGRQPVTAVDAFLKATPLARPGTPEDVSGVVAFLVSKDSSYITGQVVNIDGGMVM